MMSLLSFFGYIFIIIGVFLVFTVVIGLIRFRNIFTQIHISTVHDMLAFPMIILGSSLLFFSYGNYKIGMKLILAIIIWYMVAPITSYIIIKIAYFHSKYFKIDTTD